MANGSFGCTASAADVSARGIVYRACAAAMDTRAGAAGAGTGGIMGPPRMAAWTVSRAVPAMARGASASCTPPGSGECGMPPTTGMAGDPYGSAMAEGADGAYRTGLVRRRKPFRDPRDLESATFRRVSWRGLEASAPASSHRTPERTEPSIM